MNACYDVLCKEADVYMYMCNEWWNLVATINCFTMCVGFDVLEYLETNIHKSSN